MVHLFDLLDLLVQAADHLVGGVWHLLHHHEAHQGVHLVHTFHDNLEVTILQQN